MQDAPQRNHRTIHVHADAKVAAVAPLVDPVEFVEAGAKKNMIGAANRAGLLVEARISSVRAEVIRTLARLLVVVISDIGQRSALAQEFQPVVSVTRTAT